MNVNLFSTRLKRRRMEMGLRGKELAERMDISCPYMSQMEKGLRLPSDELLTKLANALGVSKDWLMGSPTAKDPETLVKEKTVHYVTAPCPDCARHLAEIARLNKIIDKLVSK